jgi:hypothetical protein
VFVVTRGKLAGMTTSNRRTVVAIGGGPAGVTAALRAAELQFAFPTFVEGISQAAQMLARDLGVRVMPQLWSSLVSPDVAGREG